MTRVAVVSSVYGGYDVPVPPVPQEMPDVEWVLVTDQAYELETWRTVVEPRPQLHPRLAAKVAKCRPDLYADADVHIWIDASFAIRRPDFVTWCLAHTIYGTVAQIPHPDRKRIVDEADFSHGMPKYVGLPVREQAAHYVAAGYPDGWGLWATGLIVYEGRSPFGDEWLREQMRWTYQDQVSQPPLLWQHDVRPVDMGGGLLSNPYFQLRGHRDHL